LIKESLDFTVDAEERDSAGNILALAISAGGKSFLLISIYGPNKNDPTFLKLWTIF
jgi:hypothetical protein